MEWKEREDKKQKDREKGNEEEEDISKENQDIMREEWRKKTLKRREEDDDKVEERPGKRRKTKGWRKEEDYSWGQKELTVVEEGIVKWLQETGSNNREEDKEKVMKQGKLEPWTWLRIESREVIIEIARRIEKEAQMKSTEKEELEKRKVTLNSEELNSNVRNMSLIGTDELNSNVEALSCTDGRVESKLSDITAPCHVVIMKMTQSLR